MEEKNNKILGVFVGISAIIIGMVYLLFHYEIITFNKKTNDTDAELKYTEVNTKLKEGIYIVDVSEIVEEAMPSIVSITSKKLISSGIDLFGQTKYTEGAGSGIIISKTETELLILTNYHVVKDANLLSIKFIDGNSIDGTVKGYSEEKDIAIISINIAKLKTETINSIKIATLGDSNDLKVGNGVVAIGNALGYGQSVTTGVVSALDREVKVDTYTNKMIQIDAAINGGNSGGALLNNKGEVIGINSAKYSSKTSTSASIEGMGFAIPISDVKDLINDLMNNKQTVNTVEEKIVLGIEGYIITEEMSEASNFPTGFYISKIVSNSIADKASLEIGNIIGEIDNKKIVENNDITNILNSKKKGDRISLKVYFVSGREYAVKTINIIL